MDPVVVLSVVAVAIVVIFDFTNSFHDASNIIATVIASRAMTAFQAMALVAIFEFLGPLIVGTAVANTIGDSWTSPTSRRSTPWQSSSAGSSPRSSGTS